MANKMDHPYRPTESKYKGGAHEMYVTYDVRQKTRGGNSKLYPKVKRVYIAGDVKDWETGNVKKRFYKNAQKLPQRYRSALQNVR